MWAPVQVSVPVWASVEGSGSAAVLAPAQVSVPVLGLVLVSVFRRFPVSGLAWVARQQSDLTPSRVG